MIAQHPPLTTASLMTAYDTFNVPEILLSLFRNAWNLNKHLKLNDVIMLQRLNFRVIRNFIQKITGAPQNYYEYCTSSWGFLVHYLVINNETWESFRDNGCLMKLERVLEMIERVKSKEIRKHRVIFLKNVDFSGVSISTFSNLVGPFDYDIGAIVNKSISVELFRNLWFSSPDFQGTVRWNPVVTMDLVEQTWDLGWSMSGLSDCPGITMDFILRHIDLVAEFKWSNLTMNPAISFKDIDENPGLPWSFGSLKFRKAIPLWFAKKYRSRMLAREDTLNIDLVDDELFSICKELYPDAEDPAIAKHLFMKNSVVTKDLCERFPQMEMPSHILLARDFEFEDLVRLRQPGLDMRLDFTYFLKPFRHQTTKNYVEFLVTLGMGRDQALGVVEFMIPDLPELPLEWE